MGYTVYIRTHARHNYDNLFWGQTQGIEQGNRWYKYPADSFITERFNEKESLGRALEWLFDHVLSSRDYAVELKIVDASHTVVVVFQPKGRGFALNLPWKERRKLKHWLMNRSRHHTPWSNVLWITKCDFIPWVRL